MKEVLQILPHRKDYCLLIKSAFSHEFCNEIIYKNRSSFKEANSHYPTSYRNNQRQVLDNSSLSNKLFSEIKKYIPSEIFIDGISRVEHGKWKLDSLNSRIRICRYLPNQYFNKHLDGVFYESEFKQSKLTFMIYLNGKEKFSGGRTLFFNSKTDETIIGSYEPQKGDLIIFDHNLWHSGEKVISGEKYILRSDIMYLRQSKTYPLNNLQYGEGHLGYIWTVNLLGNKLVTSGRDKKIKIWSENGKKVDELTGHKNSILDLISMQESTIVSCSRDMTIKVWIKNTNHKFENDITIKNHQGTVLCLCKINNQEFLSGGADGIVNRLNIEGKLIWSNKAHQEWIWKIEKLNDQKYVTVSEDGSLIIWNINSNNLVQKWKGNIPINSLFIKDEKNIYIGRLDGKIIHLYLNEKVNSIEKVKETICHNGIIWVIKSDEKYLFTGGEDNKVKIWMKENMILIDEINHKNFVQDLELIGDSILSVSYDGEIIKNRRPLQAT